MAHSKQHTPKVDEVRPYLHGVAQFRADKRHGPAGPPGGTALTDLEDLLLELRTVRRERLLDELLSRQAQSPPPAEAQACPTCRQPRGPGAADHPRRVQTRAGQANWVEPEAYCPRCRRAFFPSVAEPGH